MQQVQTVTIQTKAATPHRLNCDDPLLTVTEAAAESGRAASTFRRDVRQGTMPPAIYVLPRCPRWRRSEIRAAVEACRTKAA
jgi:predicted DNA-binding transcriptional regulator AlpA